jgi:cold shock CspA family protein
LQQQLLQQQQLQHVPQPNISNKKSRQQAHFSVLVRVLRDNLVQVGSKDMQLNLLINRLSEVCPDWKTRLECQTLYQYVAEAHACGLVECIEGSENESNSNTIVRLNGERSLGVVKWVKDSYGFIQSPFHTEDLFYHASEHCSDLGITIPLVPGQEVEFLIVKNALTGKLNATQIHLLLRSDSRLTELRVNILKDNTPRNQAQSTPSATVVLPGSMLSIANGAKYVFRASALGVPGSLNSQHGNVVTGATSEPETNKEPGLHKTKLCKFHPYCPRGINCWFAHGLHELRPHIEGPPVGASVFESHYSRQVWDTDFQPKSVGSSQLFQIGSDTPGSSCSDNPGISKMAVFGAAQLQSQRPLINNHVPARHPSSSTSGFASGNSAQDLPSSQQCFSAGWVVE